MITLNDRLAAASNRPAGFDYMRTVLATLVLACHTINVCYGKQFASAVWAGPAKPFLSLILPMFFALSGFLVASSLERCRTLVSFGGLRILRIIPALAVDTVISALLLGPVFTTFRLRDYFADSMFHVYFLNMVGDVHYLLPGVFAGNPWPNIVNNQLWTLPYELVCYIMIVLLAFLGIVQRPRLFLIFVVASNVALFLIYVLIKKVQPDVTVSPPVLVQCFLYGNAAFLFRKKITWSGSLFIASLAASLIFLSVPHGDYMAALPATYMTVYLGLLQPPRTWVVTSGDYSYGIFLYGFPIQQAISAILGPAGQHWYINLIVSLPLTMALAMLSWKCIEKPALQLRPLMLVLEDMGFRLAAAIPGGRFFIPVLEVRPAESFEKHIAGK